MSIAYDSPPTNQVDSYFSPHIATYSTQSPNSKDSSPSSGQTPFFTAPISPTVNQEFFAAIQNRTTFNNFVNAPLGRSNSTIDGTRSLPPSSAIPLNLSSPIANRRKGSMSGTMSSISAGASSAVVAKMTTYTPEDIVRLLSDPQQSNPEPLNPSIDPLRARHHTFTLSLLLIDVRNLVQFGESHIQGAINVCIPNMILKRPTFSMDKMIDTLIIEEDRGKLAKWEEYANIVLYDASGDSLGDNSTVGFVAQKFLTEGYAGSLGWLRGGFDSFAHRHATLLTTHYRSSAHHQKNHHPTPAPSAEASTSVPATGASAFPPVRNGGASLSRRAQLAFGSFTAPVTPHFDNQVFNPFFSNIRQNMELSKDGISERFPIRLPEGVVVVDADNVRGARALRVLYPRWLLDVVSPNGEGEKKLAKMYEHIEKAEQQRLQNIMFHSSRSSSNAADHPLSICAGLEKGALNRYTNTWPYEYTRVKINECSDDQTDYINASYVQYHPDETPAPTTRSRKHRRYIATQGPLPTTFSDFWKMVWEQRSCVLVMLTKEEEMNRIKCHCYWPSEDESVKTFDSLTVTLLRETTFSVAADEGDIVTRVFSICHLGSPSSPPLEVTQIQYTGWVDFGVPENPIGVLKVVEVADAAQKAYEAALDVEVGPMVVHCSAGCGRSGSFCTVDTVLGFFEEGEDAMGDHDLVSDVVEQFREQRVSMVQTLRQFVFCHEAIWWSVLGFADNGGGAGADSMNVDS